MTAPNFIGPSLFQPNHRRPATPGILILVSPLRIVYANALARAMVSHINQLTLGQDTALPLPDQITEFCEEVITLSEDASRRARFHPFELRREIRVAGDRLLLRGIGLPQPGAGRNSRACIMMDMLKPSMERSDGSLTRSTCYV